MLNIGQLFCNAFIIAFLAFYSAVFLALLAWGVRGVTEGRGKRTRVASTPPERQALSFSPEAPPS